MMPASGTRDCPFCAEPVRKAAVLCPHCRSDLPRLKSVRSKRFGLLFWFVLGSLGIYAWQVFEHQSKPSADADAYRTESNTSTASPNDESGYCTSAQHEKDRVTMAFAFGSGVLQKLPDEEGLNVSVNEGYWARMDYRSRVGFMRSLECAIAGPGKALASTDVRSQRSDALLAKWELGKLNAP
jgi:hypothetical protein